MPRLKCIAHSDFDGIYTKVAYAWKSEFKVGSKPQWIKVEACIGQIMKHIFKVHFDKGGQHESIMQCGTPTSDGGLVVLIPKTCHQGSQQQLLNHAHPCMRWHFEGTQLQQSQATCGRVWRVHFVDAKLAAMGVACHVYQNISQAAIDQPRRHALPMNLAIPRYFVQGNFKLVDLVVASFINARCLAGRANEHATEKIAEARVVVPVQNQTGQQFGPAQEGTV